MKNVIVKANAAVFKDNGKGMLEISGGAPVTLMVGNLSKNIESKTVNKNTRSQEDEMIV